MTSPMTTSLIPGEVITLGGAARNVAKQSVRQPLAELAVRVATDDEVATVKRFDQLIREQWKADVQPGEARCTRDLRQVVVCERKSPVVGKHSIHESGCQVLLEGPPL